MSLQRSTTQQQLSYLPIQIVSITEMLRERIEILNLNNVNQIIQLINPMILITAKAVITAIPVVVDQEVDVMTIVIIIIEGDMNFLTIKMGLINRTQHHQISSHVDQTKDDNGCGLLRILTVFGFYDFLFKKFCGT